LSDALRRVGELSLAELGQLLRDGQFAVQTGSLISRICSSLPDVARSLHFSSTSGRMVALSLINPREIPTRLIT